MFARSIRWRMLVWQALLLAAVLSGFGITAYQLYRTNRLTEIDEELERRVSALSADVRGVRPFGQPPKRPPFRPGGPGERGEHGGPGPNPSRPSAPTPAPDKNLDLDPLPGKPRRSPDDPFPTREIQLSPDTTALFEPIAPSSFYYALWSRSGNLLLASTNTPSDLTRPERAAPPARLRSRTSTTHRESYLFTEIGECVLAGRPASAELLGLRRFAAWLAAAGTAVLALGLGGGWILISRALQPISNISNTANRISAGNLAERINLADTENELGRLAAVLNTTFARLDTAFAQQRQFIADASHELRTPITVLLTETQTTLARERSATDYRETLQACLETAQQMRRLTESLLQLARLDAGHEPLQHQPFDLAEVASACLEHVRPLAHHQNLTLEAHLIPTPASGDPDRFAQVVTNLLTNAIHYNRPGGTVRIHCATDAHGPMLAVQDSGLGIHPDHLPHVFDRFYRADASRSDSTRRTGLGLAISQAIVHAHQGTLDVTSQLDVGSTFTVRLPPLAPRPTTPQS